MKEVESHGVLLLVGNNCGAAMATKVFGNKAPFAHQTALGWSLVGPSAVDFCPNDNSVVLRTTVKEHVGSRMVFDERLYDFENHADLSLIHI